MDLFISPNLSRPLRSACQVDPLRDRLADVVAESAVRLLDPDLIEAIGEDMGIVQKKRVHHSGLLVCAMVLAALERGSDTEGRWLDTQTTYRRLGGPDSGTTSIRKMGRRMMPIMQEMMRRRMSQIIIETRDNALRGRLAGFRDVLIPDGCAFKLASVLSGISPGTGQPAELKLHAVYSVKAATASEVTVTAGSVHDSEMFWPAWTADALYIWDLGYQSVDRFVEASLAGAHVLQRLKDGFNPVVVASYGKTGHRKPLVGVDGEELRLNEACQFGNVHNQPVLDLDVRIVDHDKREVIARVACVPFNGEDHYYLTTLPRTTFSPHDVAELYRVRWEVELFFKGWKSGARMDHVHRLKNPSSLAVAVTASMLAALLARDMHSRLESLSEEVGRAKIAELEPSRPDGFSPRRAAPTAA